MNKRRREKGRGWGEGGEDRCRCDQVKKEAGGGRATACS